MEQKPSTALSRLAASRGITLPTVPKASPTAAPSRLIRRPEVEAMTGLPKSTLYDYLQAGTFPAPVKLGQRNVAWSLASVQGWIDSRVSARPNQKAA